MSDLLDEAHEFLLCMDKMEYADALFALRAELTEARRQLAAQPAVPEAVEQIRSVLADIVCEDDALKAVNSIRDILSAADSEVKE